jgi:chemotaxis methyl-accepting protein methylase
MLRLRALRRTAVRSQGHTYTCFLRSPVQMQAVTGPVLEYLIGPGSQAEAGAGGSRSPIPLEILVFACSNGAEAYTLASSLRSARPDLAFHIHASDLHPEMVEKARAAAYSVDEVHHSEDITPEFIEATFDLADGRYVVKPEIRERVSFSQASLLSPQLSQQFAPADIVVAQNVLFHLDPPVATSAFENLYGLLKPRSVLLVEGMDLDMRLRLTRARQLHPLAYRHREIYERSRAHVSLEWWRHYYGAEPYSAMAVDRVRRYGSIFLKGPQS